MQTFSFLRQDWRCVDCRRFMPRRSAIDMLLAKLAAGRWNSELCLALRACDDDDDDDDDDGNSDDDDNNDDYGSVVLR